MASIRAVRPTPSTTTPGATFTQQGTGATQFTSTYIYTGVAFNNAGSVNVNQGMLQLNAGVTQVSGSTLTGGTWNILAGGTLSIPGAAIATNDGNVTLDGTGSTFTAINSLAVNNGSFTSRQRPLLHYGRQPDQ